MANSTTMANSTLPNLLLAPAQWRHWTRLQSMDDFFVAMCIMTLGGCLLHAFHLFTHPKPVLQAKYYKSTDVGDSASHPRVEDAACFTNLILSCFFVFNWVIIHAGVLPSPLTMGMQGGACAGYELYSALVEMHLLVQGTRRIDMIVHHSLCFGFIAVTCVAYAMTSASDLVIWHLVWDSISRMLVSNLPLNLRHFYRDTTAISVLFALTFLTVRGLEQVRLVGDMSTVIAASSSSTRTLPWHDTATGFVVACWAMLQALNCVWIYRVLRQVVRLVTRGTNGASKKSASQQEAQHLE